MSIKKDKIWAPIEELVFAILVIVAFYAIGFATKGASGRGITPAGIHEPDILGASESGHPEALYGLSICGIVITFVAIIMPVISIFWGKDNFLFITGWSTIFLNVVAVVMITAAISLWASDQTVEGEILYNKGYLAGQFILAFAGAGSAFAGTWVAYRNELLDFKRFYSHK